jgi:hypothetical protein
VEATELARLQFALLAAVHFLFVLSLFNTRPERAKDDGAGPDVLLRFGAASPRVSDDDVVGPADDRLEPAVAR